MATGILSETRIGLSDLAKREGVNSSTAWRWVLRGVRGHRLESITIGGKRVTSEEAFARWVAAQNNIKCPPVTSKQRMKELQAAEQELDAAGL